MKATSLLGITSALVLAVACGRTTVPTEPTPVSPGTPAVTFGTGQHRVGTDIAAARYFADPSPGCYWERQANGAGTATEIVANQFVGFDAAQWIVDILPADRSFETTADCGTWRNSATAGSQPSIRPGVWLVGTQVAARTYGSNVSDGCYWERLGNFENVLSSVHANDFVESGGQRFVTIQAGDVGFMTTIECGTWMPAQMLTTGGAAMSATDIEQNRAQYRSRMSQPR